MFRPEGGSGRRRRAVLVGAVLLAVAGFDPLTAAHAFPSDPQPSAEPSTLPDTDRNETAAAAEDKERLAGDVAYGLEQRAQELYLDGMEKLDGGHRDWARQTFETLIARFPDSTAAGLARRRLGELYRATTTDTSPPPRAPQIAAPSGQATTTVARSRVWEQELRRNAPIQSKLRGEAGDRIFFSSGSAELGTRARAALAAQAQWLIRWREFEAAVEGHADEPGTEDENVMLSEQRAESVRRRLIAEGVEASRVAVVAAGRTHRVAMCTASDCKAQNRRAVTLVFARGTRARLGLSGPASAEAFADRAPPALVPAKTVQAPAAAEQAGVAR